MNFLKAAWAWLNGKKTVFAVCYWSSIVPSLAVIYPNGVPANIQKTEIVIGLILSALGLGSKMVNAINNKQADNISQIP